MKFDAPATTNPIDQLKVVGKPIDRIEGSLKASGTATYAYEYNDIAPNAVYGYIVGAGIARGRIERIDDAAARRAPGVLAVLTHQNAGPIGLPTFLKSKALAGPQIDHYHQAVALVIAESFEEARDGAALLRIDYAHVEGRFDLEAEAGTAPIAPEYFLGPSVNRVRDFDAAFAAAPVTVDAQYTTPDQSHAMMEPQATVAVWQGEFLTCWTSTQTIAAAANDLAAILGIPVENIRIVSPFVGGGFGSKSFIQSDIVLAALASRLIGRGVKVAMQRSLLFNNTTHRPATIQRIRLGATRDGKITAIAHEGVFGNVPGGWQENVVVPTRHLYAIENRLTSVRMATLDLPEGSVMRAPGEASGMMALEVAMDELAEKLVMDPVELRIRNDAETSSENPERPFSHRGLIECFRTGAEQFGWQRRQARPGSVRDGRWLVGWGTAAAVRGAIAFPSAARVRLRSNGSVLVECDMTDIGTGSYTIIAQTAAEMMGLDITKVSVRLGDSLLPRTPGSGGQFGAASVTAAVYAACLKLRESAARRLDLDPGNAMFADGLVRSGDRSVPLVDAARDGELAAEDTVEYGDLFQRFDQQTFGAHFVEVGVDVATGEIRVRRMLMVCSAGRIINPKTARNQIIGGMTMGIGAALMEELVVDKREGFFVNHDLAGYEVPVHADVPRQEVIFLDEIDPMTGPLKAKGIGELGISGAAAAIANAVYNATGIRVRDYPITLDKLVDRLPAIW